MKKILFCMLIAGMAVSVAQAQVGRPSLGIGLEVGVPTGDLDLSQKIGIGGSADFDFNVGAGTALTLSAGYISFSGDEIANNVKLPAVNFIPIKAGVRYFVVPSLIYLEPQLGYTSISTPNSSSATGGFTYAAKAGVRFSGFDVSARYEGVSRNNENLNFIGLRLGYNFSL